MAQGKYWPLLSRRYVGASETAAPAFYLEVSLQSSAGSQAKMCKTTLVCQDYIQGRALISDPGWDKPGRALQGFPNYYVVKTDYAGRGRPLLSCRALSNFRKRVLLVSLTRGRPWMTTRPHPDIDCPSPEGKSGQKVTNGVTELVLNLRYVRPPGKGGVKAKNVFFG